MKLKVEIKRHQNGAEIKATPKSVECLFPISKCYTYDRYIPIQILILTLLRNVMLTVPKGAWDTCE